MILTLCGHHNVCPQAVDDFDQPLTEGRELFICENCYRCVSHAGCANPLVDSDVHYPVFAAIPHSLAWMFRGPARVTPFRGLLRSASVRRKMVTTCVAVSNLDARIAAISCAMASLQGT